MVVSSMGMVLASVCSCIRNSNCTLLERRLLRQAFAQIVGRLRPGPGIWRRFLYGGTDGKLRRTRAELESAQRPELGVEHAIDLEAPHLLDEAQFPADALRWRERAKEK